MFLFKQALIREACLFNLINTAHQQAYNAMLAEEGKTLFIQKRKEWGVQGFVSPDMEADYDPDKGPAFITKSDSFYVFVEYNRTPDSPWQPPNRAEQYAGYVTVNGVKVAMGGRGAFTRAERDAATIDLEAEEVLSSGDPEHHIIDISKHLSAKPVRAKKSKKPKTAKEAVDKAIKKGGPKKASPADFLVTIEQMLEPAKKKAPASLANKRMSKATTVDAKLEVVAEDLKLSIEQAARDVALSMKGAGKQGQSDMVGYMADQLRVNPEGAKTLIAKILQEAPERFPGVTSVDQLVSRILAMDNGVAKPTKD